MQKKGIKTVFKVIFVILLFALINLTNGETRKVTLFEEIIQDIITLPERGIVYLKNLFKEDKNQLFKNIEELNSENESLKEEIKNIKEKMSDYELIVAENENLKSHIQLKEEHVEHSTIIADVIMTSSSNWSLVYTINKGEKDGIMPGQAVITSNGLVGFVETTTSNTAKVVSILDAGNSVSVRVTRTRDTALLKGNSSLASKNQMKLINIPTSVSLSGGDKIETSGLGGVYPKGIIIGKVVSFEQKENPIENEAIVESFVDFSKLETVAVIVEQ